MFAPLTTVCLRKDAISSRGFPRGKAQFQMGPRHNAHIAVRIACEQGQYHTQGAPVVARQTGTAHAEKQWNVLLFKKRRIEDGSKTIR